MFVFLPCTLEKSAKCEEQFNSKIALSVSILKLSRKPLSYVKLSIMASELLRKAISTTEPRVSNVFIRAVDRANTVDITIAYNIEGIVDQQNLEVSVSRVR